MRKFKILLTAAALAASLVFTGCGNGAEDGSQNNAQIDGNQTDMPQKGDTIAIFHMKDFGDITVRFFENGAPKAVENFVTHAKDGYYDGVTFHRVIDGFMIQGGDPDGTGAGGESIWGTEFEDEIVENLLPIRGALCMANRGPDTNGSQFFIVQSKSSNLSYASGLTDDQKKSFEENGGYPSLTGGYTVFGQVIEGMDVVDKIAAVQTDASDKPLESVVIESIEITTY